MSYLYVLYTYIHDETEARATALVNTKIQRKTRLLLHAPGFTFSAILGSQLSLRPLTSVASHLFTAFPQGFHTFWGFLILSH